MYLHLLNRLQHGAGIDIWKGVDLFVDLRTGHSIQFNGHYRFAAFLLSGNTEIADINAFFSHELCYSSNDAGGIFVKDDESGILAGKRNFHAVDLCYKNVSSANTGTQERYLAAICIC